MTDYRIFETKVFREDLNDLPKSIGTKVQQKLTDYIYPQLRAQPHFGPNIKKLRGWTPETWRYRIGPWRLFYEVDDRQKIIFMTALDNRKDAY